METNEKVSKVIELVQYFDKNDWDNFSKLLYKVRRPEMQPYKNPISTNQDAYELQQRIVQLCIDFIKERNLTDIYEVTFNADNLNESALYGEWTPATDSYLSLIGSQQEDDSRYPVRKIIAESY